jgi:1-acyl-sn-glycerol-3-phosphate acyltransferase
VRLFIGWIFFVFSTIVFTLPGLVSWFFSRSGRWGAWSTRQWSRSILWAAGIRWSLAGKEHVRKGEAYVIVANHASMLDIAVCSAGLPVLFHFVSRPFFFKIPLMGWGMFFTRQIPIDRDNPRKAARALRDLDRRFRNGTSVLLFPEGTRSPDGSIARYKRGPFLTTIRGGVPVLPVRLRGVHELLPKGNFSPRPGKVTMTIGEPFPTTGMADRDARGLAERVEAWTRGADA